MENNERSLFDLPLVLFEQFAKKHGISQDPFNVITPYTDVVCRYVLLKDTDSGYKLTLVFVEKKDTAFVPYPTRFVGITIEPPTHWERNGNLRTSIKIFAKTISVSFPSKVKSEELSKVHSLGLEVILDNNCMQINDNRKKELNKYLVELQKDTHDLYWDKTYNWTTSCLEKQNGEVLPLRIRNIRNELAEQLSL